MLRKSIRNFHGSLPLSSKKIPPQIGKKVKADKEDEKQKDEKKETSEPFYEPHNVSTGEYNGPRGKEPTRYGDWERNGRCYDF